MLLVIIWINRFYILFIYLFIYLVPPRLATIAPIETNLDEHHPQRVSFPCRVERGSSESLSLEWQYLNKTAIQSTNGIYIDKSRLDSDKLIELRFDPLRREHFGNYSCVAKNLADSSYALASLYIQCKMINHIKIFFFIIHDFSSTGICWTKYSNCCNNT
jgi:hypothetical protein